MSDNNLRDLRNPDASEIGQRLGDAFRDNQSPDTGFADEQLSQSPDTGFVGTDPDTGEPTVNPDRSSPPRRSSGRSRRSSRSSSSDDEGDMSPDTGFVGTDSDTGEPTVNPDRSSESITSSLSDAFDSADSDLNRLRRETLDRDIRREDDDLSTPLRSRQESFDTRSFDDRVEERFTDRFEEPDRTSVVRREGEQNLFGLFFDDEPLFFEQRDIVFDTESEEFVARDEAMDFVRSSVTRDLLDRGSFQVGSELGGSGVLDSFDIDDVNPRDGIAGQFSILNPERNIALEQQERLRQVAGRVEGDGDNVFRNIVAGSIGFVGGTLTDFGAITEGAIKFPFSERGREFGSSVLSGAEEVRDDVVGDSTGVERRFREGVVLPFSLAREGISQVDVRGGVSAFGRGIGEGLRGDSFDSARTVGGFVLPSVAPSVLRSGQTVSASLRTDFTPVGVRTGRGVRVTREGVEDRAGLESRFIVNPAGGDRINIVPAGGGFGEPLSTQLARAGQERSGFVSGQVDLLPSAGGFFTISGRLGRNFDEAQLSTAARRDLETFRREGVDSLSDQQLLRLDREVRSADGTLLEAGFFGSPDGDLRLSRAGLSTQQVSNPFEADRISLGILPNRPQAILDMETPISARTGVGEGRASFLRTQLGRETTTPAFQSMERELLIGGIGDVFQAERVGTTIVDGRAVQIFDRIPTSSDVGISSVRLSASPTDFVSRGRSSGRDRVFTITPRGFRFDDTQGLSTSEPVRSTSSTALSGVVPFSLVDSVSVPDSSSPPSSSISPPSISPPSSPPRTPSSPPSVISPPISTPRTPSTPVSPPFTPSRPIISPTSRRGGSSISFPLINPPFTPSSPTIPSDSDDDRSEDFFRIFVRKGGLFQLRGFEPSVDDAFSRGVLELGRGAEASFKVADRRGLVSPDDFLTGLGDDFRLSRVDDDVVVKRRRARISTPEELRDITFRGVESRRRSNDKTESLNNLDFSNIL